MRFRSYMAAGTLALMPVLAMAGQADAAPAAQPMFVNVNGQAVPVKTDTRVVQTAVGPMQVRTWSWHSPHGGASFEMQTSSSGSMPPAAALRQMQVAQYQMQAAQAQMVAMQQQMMALQHVALANALAMPMPQPVGFAMPMWAMPEPVVVIVPAQPSTRALAPAPSAPARPATRGPEIKA
ncbi:hypothetical protein CH72_4017 [Burkholderia ambifaria AMMD]|uniref:Uncharacterized protein n=1 Tax=Burkholderia ambifaria (strain ATCC BAA-244 / DSM 16087 / CCUG 44356 / LMG 19182 / AMMD) TaxID=339670 RepID=Q0B8I5_BURCM|nr:hypothetical protein [Burkholderia ambifaria]ABI89538.1 hypothetical protein Bamb_3984 [Burkholderia ambifaria AMMD]AJY23835.1 hypothetical protein CH72_4017 [Burkholderia ambifaria AMMD]MBR7930079.1 hypothetical protein [Burkholderia ambifaria]PEH67663.1 hypothetical protein CRM91_06520 [Burkholderia ambifaria]QQC07800.1 hypothetical protein I6H84_20265 [Burkholderia ambifaria]